MPVVTYYHFENDSTEGAVRAAVDPLIQHMPEWVRSVNVYSLDYLGDQEDCVVATCSPEPDYRRVIFKVSSLFFDMATEKQFEYIVHEFFHAVLGEIGQWVQRRLINPTKDRNEELYRHVSGEFTERMERAVQELTFMFQALLEKTGKEKGGYVLPLASKTTKTPRAVA